MNNLFDDCLTDKDIMHKLFSLASTNQYSRQELNILAALRREEIKKNKTSNQTSMLSIKKIIKPSNDMISKINIEDSGVLLLSGDINSSSSFEFMIDSFGEYHYCF